MRLDGGGSLRAARAIVTVPLGVLKHGDIEFKPPLSEAKADAIAALGFGVLDKVQALGPRATDTSPFVSLPVIYTCVPTKIYSVAYLTWRIGMDKTI